MPSPRPIKRQWERSAPVPCASRGYQEMGTVSARPSTSSTTNESSLNETRCACAGAISIGEVLMPCSEKLFRQFGYEPLDVPDLRRREAATVRQPHGIQPELRAVRITLNMNMRGFVPIGRVKEQAIRTCAMQGRHRFSLARFDVERCCRQSAPRASVRIGPANARRAARFPPPCEHGYCVVLPPAPNGAPRIRVCPATSST